MKHIQLLGIQLGQQGYKQSPEFLRLATLRTITALVEFGLKFSLETESVVNLIKIRFIDCACLFTLWTFKLELLGERSKLINVSGFYGYERFVEFF